MYQLFHADFAEGQQEFADLADYKWLTGRALTLAQGGSGWAQLSAADYPQLQAIAAKNSFSGFMAAGVTSLLGISNYNWPSPNKDAIPAARYAQFEPEENGNNAAPDAIRVYPNPSSGLVNLYTPHSGQLYLSNIQGQQVAVYELKAGENQLRIPPGLPTGLYLGRAVLQNGQQSTAKIIYRP